MLRETSGRGAEIEIRNGIIAAVRPGDGPAERRPNDDWVGPAFWDIQLNGRWGHSFSSPELTVEHVVAIVRAQGSLGTARLCPTLITAQPGQMLHGVRTIAAACEADPETARKVLGIHMAAVSWPIAEVLGTVTRNPALLLGRSPPELEPGQPACLVVFRHGAPDEFILTRTVVDGVWHESAT